MVAEYGVTRCGFGRRACGPARAPVRTVTRITRPSGRGTAVSARRLRNGAAQEADHARDLGFRLPASCLATPDQG